MDINDIQNFLAQGMKLDATILVNGREANFAGITFVEKDGQRIARLQFNTPKKSKAKPEITVRSKRA